MLKGIVSGVEKDIKRIPMLVGNEYKEGWEVRDNQDRLIWGREDEFQTTTGTLKFKGYSLPVKVKSLLGNDVQNGTPTPDSPIMPEFCGEKTGNLANLYGVDKTFLGLHCTVSENMSVVINGTKTSGPNVRPLVNPNIMLPAGTYTVKVKMVSGSTTNVTDGLVFGINASAYELRTTPGVKQVGDTGKRTFTLIEDTLLSSIDITASYGSVGSVWDNATFQCWFYSGSDDKEYEPYGYKLPFTNAGQTTNVYLGQTPTVRRIKKLVLDGTESWGINSTKDNTVSFFLYNTKVGKLVGSFYSNIYPQSLPWAYVGNADTGLSWYAASSFGFKMEKTLIGGDTAEAFKSYLAAQYTAGTPVTVWYVLAESETGIVNEPVAKIGDYADELNNTVATLPEIPTTTGQNTLTVDTTLVPSSLTIKGHIKEWQPENLLPVSKFEDLSDPSWWSGGYYIRYNNMPAGTYVMSTNMPEKDPGDVYFNGENALNVPYEGRPVSQTISEGGSFYVLFFVDRGGYEKILDGTYTVTLIRS